MDPSRFLILLLGLPCAAQNWIQMPDFPGTPRDDGSAFVIGTDIYVGTGMDVSFQVTTDWHRYNTLDNTWSPAATLPSDGRQYCSSFTLNGKGYLFGGVVFGVPTNELWQFDPGTESWTQRASAANSLSASTAVAYDDRGHVLTGNAENNLPSTIHQVYDPVNDSWSLSVALPGEPLHRAASFVHEGMIHVVGGSLAGFSAVGSNWAFDASQGDWAARSDLPAPRFAGDAIGVPDGGLFIGGAVSNALDGPQADVWHYIAATDSWETYPALPAGTRRGGVIAFVPPNQVYYGTGSDNAARYNDWWKLELPVGLSEMNEPAGFTLGPSPADTHLDLTRTQAGMNAIWSIHDAQGRLVHSIPATSSHHRLDTRSWPAGAYVAVLADATQRVAKRFVVIH